MLSLLALACWIGGLVLLTVSPLLGAFVAAGGFVAAGFAVRRRDDMETMFGVMFLAVLGVGAVRFILWLFG
jgi:hypothetical protein